MTFLTFLLFEKLVGTIFLLYILSAMAKDKKTPKDDKLMKGASSTQKKKKAPAVDRSRSVVSTRSKVDED